MSAISMTTESLLLLFCLLLCIALIAALSFLVLLRKNNKLMLGSFLESASQGVIIDYNAKLQTSEVALELLKASKLSNLQEISKYLSVTHGVAYLDALKNLKQEGVEFNKFFDVLGDKGVLSIKGQRIKAAYGAPYIIWIDDASVMEMMLQNFADAERQSKIQSRVLDEVPIPIWWRDSETLNLIGCNAAYADIFEKNKTDVIQQQLELGEGSISQSGLALAKRAARSVSAQSESHSIIVAGKRQLLDFTERKAQDSLKMVYGYAFDLTQLDDLQTQMANHIASHDEILDDMQSAIVIFGSDKRLKYHNSALLRLFDFSEAEMQGSPGYGELMENLRKRRQLPEVIDFPTYKREQEAKFNTVLSRQENLLHLPDGRTIRQYMIPHLSGGLMLMLEDVTDNILLESKFNTLIAVQKATLNNLLDAVSVWGSDGKLKIWNQSFEAIWSFPEQYLDTNPHISDLVDYFYRNWLKSDGDEEDALAKIEHILEVTERESKSYKLELRDGRWIETSLVPLPDAQVLMIHSDITDSERVERALADRNAAFHRADLLKSQFLSNISYELRTPINAISGFASILKEEYYGVLNDRQKAHVRNILEAGDTLSQLVTDILDLATIQANLLTLNKELHNLSMVVQGCFKTVEEYAMERKQTIRLHKALIPHEYICDRDRLGRAFSNVLHTVVSFTQGDLIVVKLKPLEDGYEVAIQTNWVISDPEDREFMLNRFEGNDPNALRTGVGLNLSLAKSLIGTHQGTMKAIVNSKAGFAVVITLKNE